MHERERKLQFVGNRESWISGTRSSECRKQKHHHQKGSGKKPLDPGVGSHLAQSNATSLQQVVMESKRKEKWCGQEIETSVQDVNYTACSQFIQKLAKPGVRALRDDAARRSRSFQLSCGGSSIIISNEGVRAAAGILFSIF